MSRPAPTAAGQLPQHLERPGAPPALPLAGEQRQGHPEAPARHPDLVDGLLLAGHRPGQLAEDAGHPVLEQEGRTVVGRDRAGVTGSSPRSP